MAAVTPMGVPAQQQSNAHPSTVHIGMSPARPLPVGHEVSTRVGGVTGQETGMTSEPLIAGGPNGGVGHVG